MMIKILFSAFLLSMGLLAEEKNAEFETAYLQILSALHCEFELCDPNAPLSVEDVAVRFRKAEFVTSVMRESNLTLNQAGAVVEKEYRKLLGEKYLEAFKKALALICNLDEIDRVVGVLLLTEKADEAIENALASLRPECGGPLLSVRERITRIMQDN